jgi:hypothetical protein
VCRRRAWDVNNAPQVHLTYRKRTLKLLSRTGEFPAGRSEVKSIRIGWDERAIVVDVSELNQTPFGGPNGVGIEGVVVFNLIEEGLEAKHTSPWNVIVNAELWRELFARANDYAVAMSVSDGRDWSPPCPASIEP